MKLNNIAVAGNFVGNRRVAKSGIVTDETSENMPKRDGQS